MSFTVAALYRFARFPDPDTLRSPLRALCEAEAVRGSLLLAPEGINGTIGGPEAGIAKVVAHIRTLPDCADLDVKYASTDTLPFGKMRVRLKREIVTMGAGDLDPTTNAGTHVCPQDWNALIADPDTLLIDTRNAYEVAIGSFPGAIDPGTARFGDFPRWFDALTEDLTAQGRTPKIAMFCTGGIRCEKSTAYAKAKGFADVYHLDGGILRYLEEIPEQESVWQGDCFVFDKRVAVTQGLAQGDHHMCMACGMPVRNGATHTCAENRLLSKA